MVSGENNTAIPAAFCSEKCLQIMLQQQGQKIALRKKVNAGNVFRLDGKLYFPVEKSEIPNDRLLGAYSNKHFKSLSQLKEHPVDGVLPVCELCGCTYAVPWVDGRMLFDANTIPDDCREIQSAILGQQSSPLTWGDFSKWVCELVRALLKLHELGLAHGDVTVFNIIVDGDGHAIWLDLENLNDDPEQIENDCIAFIFHVFLFLYENLSEAPQDFFAELTEILLQAKNGRDLLMRLSGVLSRLKSLEVLDRTQNRATIFRLLTQCGQKNRKGFLCRAYPYLIRSAVYFQYHFLWLVNYNMKVMHYEKIGLYDLYMRLCTLSETEQQRASFDSELRKQIAAVQDELSRAHLREVELQKSFEEKKNAFLSEISALANAQVHDQAMLAAAEEAKKSLHVQLEKEQLICRERSQALHQTEILLRISRREQRVAQAQVAKEQRYCRQLITQLQAVQTELSRLKQELSKTQAENRILEQGREETRFLRIENNTLQESNLVFRNLIRERDVELSSRNDELATMRETVGFQQRQLKELEAKHAVAQTQIQRQTAEVTVLSMKLQESMTQLCNAQNVIHGYDQKFIALQEELTQIPRLESDLAAARDSVVWLRTEKQQAMELLGTLKEQIRLLCENPSFRVAKLLQIIQHPDYAGFSSRSAVFRRLFTSPLSGKPFCRNYLALNSLLRLMDDGLRIMHGTRTQEHEEKLLPPDDTVLISIVLPVYNQADMLGESIDSIVNQTYRNWELIVLNDGSTDDVDAVMKRYESDSRIHYLIQQNQRLPKALSNAFKYVKGELLTWTSADNNMRPEMLERLSAFMRLHPEVDLVYADYAVIDNSGKPLHAEWFRPQNKYTPESDELHLPRTTELLNVIKDNFIGASFMYRRNTLSLIGDYDPQLGVEDYDYWMRINDLGKIAHLGTDEILYEYRVHDNSLNGKAREFKILEKSLQLMEYEKERFAFYNGSFDIYGSYHEGDLYFGSFTVRFAAGEPPAATGNIKRILLLKGGELGNYSDEDFDKYDYIAVFFDLNEENDCGKYAAKIRRNRLACFARPDSPSAHYLAMFVPDHAECLPGEFGRLALVGANNRIFWKRTRSERETSMRPAYPARKLNGAIIILLEQLGTGGMEQVALDMAKNFAAEGRKTLLVCVKDFRADLIMPREVIFQPLDRNAAIEDFQRLLETEKPDAVIAHYTTWGAKIVHDLNIPFYQVLHNTYVWFGEDECRDYRENDAYTCAYFAVSSSVAWDAAARLSLLPEKIIVLENGIDSGVFFQSKELRKKQRQELKLADSDILLLNPASCYGAKGQLHLIHAFAKIADKFPNLRLVFAGKILEEAYAEQIRAVIQENHFEDRVIFGQYFQNMNELYNAADAVVMASFWEGCSLAIAEAVQCGCPIVSTITGDVERQTAECSRLLVELPVRYQTELNQSNIAQYLYMPNAELIKKLASALAVIAAGSLQRMPDIPKLETAETVYRRYLRAFDLLGAGFVPLSIRHNL